MISAPTRPAFTPASAGIGDWLLHMWRLTRWTLLAAWRRVMSKVLLGILLGLFMLILGFVVLGYAIAQSAPVQGQVCAPVATTPVQSGNGQSGGPQPVECQPLPPEQQQAIRDQQAAAVRATLTFPQSVLLAGGYATFMGLIVLSILAGAVIGGEYGFGTIRLILSRGTGRAQLLTAQVAALALLALGISLMMVLLGIAVGFSLGPLLGASVPALSGGGMVALAAYWLAISLHLFAFAAIAFLLATLARSTAAGIAVPLGYYVFETIVSTVLLVLIQVIHGTLGDFLRHVPDWLLNVNLGVVTSKAQTALLTSTSLFQDTSGGGGASLLPSIGLAHALLVSLGYCAVLIGVPYVILRRRDITD